MLKKFILFIVLFVFFLSGFSVNATPDSFSDLQPTHRFYEEMVFLEAEGIITGYPDGTYRPNEEVTRAAAAIMIGRALGLNGEQRETKFSDVGTSQKASGYIASAVAEGIIQGYPDGTYRPNETVTRAQMAIFLSRAFKLTVEDNAPFTDISPSMASYTHIKKIIAENLTAGYPDNTFRPNIKVTRAQFSAFLARALNDDFKVELPNVYTKDPNKIYTYETNENGTVRYVYSDEDYPDWNLWHVYDKFGGPYDVVERQDREGYKIGAPYSEYALTLANPVEVGHRWDVIYGDEVLATYEITSTTMTVTTPVGTFENVVEVRELNGWRGYYVPNIGLVKAISGDELLLDLTAIENR